jgi:DsbC/DsbD-like thiol-disulfide interchange protein
VRRAVRLRPLFASAATVALAAALAGVSRAQVPEVPLTAIPEFATVAPGATLGVAVRLDVPAGWHIDWTNPGETGLPTTLAWRTPAGLVAGATAWPLPERLEDASGVSHVLRGAVYVVTPFMVEPTARTGSATLSADLTWLLCAGSCVRQSGTVRTVVRVGRDAAGSAGRGVRDPAWAPVEAARAAFPVAGEGLTLRASASGDSVRLEIAGLRGAPPTNSAVTWFPAAPGRAALVVPVHGARGTVAVVVPRSHVMGSPPGRLTGVLVGLLVREGTATSRALAVDVPVAGAAR